jgi:pantoate kinase
LAQAHAHSIDQLTALTIAERNSRENWQVANSPTIRQYVDVQTGAGAFSGSTSNALATAIALNQNNGLNSAIGGCNYLRVARVSGSRLCGCDTCEG